MAQVRCWSSKVSSLLQEVMPERSLDDLTLPRDVLEISKEVVQERHRLDLLRSYNLEPRNRPASC